MHLLRVMTSEFIYHHVISNPNRMNEGNLLLQAYFQDLYFVEVFLSVMRVNHYDGDSVQE